MQNFLDISQLNRACRRRRLLHTLARLIITLAAAAFLSLCVLGLGLVRQHAAWLCLLFGILFFAAAWSLHYLTRH